MTYKLNPLEKEALRTFGKGIATSMAVSMVESAYVLTQKPYLNLTETIASLPGFLLKRIFVHDPSAILYQFGLNAGRK